VLQGFLSPRVIQLQVRFIYQEEILHATRSDGAAASSDPRYLLFLQLTLCSNLLRGVVKWFQVIDWLADRLRMEHARVSGLHSLLYPIVQIDRDADLKAECD